MVIFLPSLSPIGPANIAPKNPPPVNTDTTAPTSASLGLNWWVKFGDAIASAMTPKS